MRPVLKSAAVTWVTAPVMLPARCSPYPVTTISARLTALAVMAMSAVTVCPSVTVTERAAGAYPISRARSESLPAGTSVRTYWPSCWLWVERDPKETWTPASGWLDPSWVIRPRMMPPCA
jgi:hypothetical protein